MRLWAALAAAVALIALSGCAELQTGTNAAESTTETETSAPLARAASPAPEPESSSPDEPNPSDESGGSGSEESEPESDEPKGNDESGGCGSEEEDVGSLCHAEDAKFCSEHECIANFDNGTGEVVECADGEFSHSGGHSGACSYHGGEN